MVEMQELERIWSILNDPEGKDCGEHHLDYAGEVRLRTLLLLLFPISWVCDRGMAAGPVCMMQVCLRSELAPGRVTYTLYDRCMKSCRSLHPSVSSRGRLKSHVMPRSAEFSVEKPPWCRAYSAQNVRYPSLYDNERLGSLS